MDELIGGALEQQATTECAWRFAGGGADEAIEVEPAEIGAMREFVAAYILVERVYQEIEVAS